MKIVRIRAASAGGDCSGAHGDQQHLMDRCLPSQAVRLGSRHQKEVKRGVVVHRDAAVDKNERVRANLDDLWRKIDGCSRARPDQLPKWQLEIASGAVWRAVVFGE